MFLALDTLWLTMATLLSTMKIENDMDKNGNPIGVELEQFTENGFLWYVTVCQFISAILSTYSIAMALKSDIAPFPCRVTPRNGRLALIEGLE